MKKVAFHVAAVLGLMANASVCGAVDLNREIDFIIPAQKLDAALMQFSRQAKIQVIASTPNLEEFLTTGASGNLTIGEALNKLLGNSGLAFKKIGEETVAIVPAQSETVFTRFEQTSTALRLAQAEEGSANIAERSSESRAGSQSATVNTPEQQRIQLEEVIVTGSHIRGAENLSSPLIVFDRVEIERSGHATTQDFIRSLPQNLSNISDGTFGAENGGSSNSSTYGGSAINLRGLGQDATLVLLDGRRLASAGQISFVDVSLIPLSAIERVEVLTDGASALYGSDAIGGVVNFVLRKDFSGAETRLRYGTVTEGDQTEIQAGQMVGHAWNSGHAFLNYEYYRRTALDGADRDFVQPTNGYTEYELIPGQKRHGVLGAFSQSVSDRVEVAGNVFFGQREGSHSYLYEDVTIRTDMEVEQYGGALDLSVDLARDWQLRFSGLTDQSQSNYVYDSFTTANESRLWSMNLAADGSLMSIPGGDVRLALGGQFRNERFVERDPSYPARLKRDITAAYAELLAPWVSAQNRRPGVERLEMSLAGRFEDYSDFGSTFNPKIGVAWAPTSALNVRSTWGTSFKAPQFFQMNPGGRSVLVFEDRFQDSVGTTTAIYLAGNGENLGAEEATSWTVGFDLDVPQTEGLAISATYFDIDYEEKIQPPFVGSDYYSALVDPIFASFVTRNPDPGAIAGLLASPRASCFSADFRFLNCPEMPLDRITAVVNGRLTNLSAVRMSGIDVSIRYPFSSLMGSWEWQLNGTQLLESRQQVLPGIPETSNMNNVWRPVDLRVRSSLSFSRGALGATAFVNYTDGYRDARPPSSAGPLQRSEVASWTTVDLSLHYDLTRVLAGTGLQKTTLSLHASNLFDRDPPFAANTAGLHYDGVNATPQGRFISAQVTTTW